jgi:hypothetical protein
VNSSPLQLKPLPVGIQSFDKLIEGGYLYVDKTRLLYELVKDPTGVYFLSRPRRFGKSLLISTLDALFSNRRELFKDLWIDSSKYKWQKFPVIRLDMTITDRSSAETLNNSLILLLREIIREHDLTVETDILPNAFSEVISQLSRKYNEKVVVLVDEYDKPILDNITKPEMVKEIREVLKTFYSILKAQDDNLRFIFLTGVSKFSKMSIFSGLNNLEDISLNSDFASICGYTQ